MRLLLLIPMLMACQTAPVIVQPPPPPPPKTDLIRLESNPIKQGFVLARGESRIIVVMAKLLSPDPKKVKINITSSPGLEVDPPTFTITGNSSANLTVKVPTTGTDDKPFFRISGQALDNNNNPITSNVPEIFFQWDVPKPPAP
jgi:hypothetical protein